ncbi:PAS domain-containing protein [Magnetospira sp. QH-2]|uniref:GGDEF domain-containing protein n=1 Tax=Magnetospira sp. (strain QH-2) TaxID=1288970 RepID=UPI0003E8173A|nr:PAS domain-containing protein [Magnetospira sp. QH-2]CCQ73401.1 Protein of unknown function [Magnetospira sp. QH-2]
MMTATRPERDRPESPCEPAQMRLLEAMLDTSPVAVAVTAPEDLHILFANAALGRILSLEPALLAGERLVDRVLSKEDAAKILDHIGRGDGVGPLSTRLRSRDQAHRWTTLTLEPVATSEGMVVLWWIEDEEEMRRLEQRLGASLIKEHKLLQRLESLDMDLGRMTAEDPLTGALVRERFIELGELELIGARRYREHVAVLTVTLLDFEPICEFQGLAASEDAVKTVAGACQKSLRQVDYFGHLNDHRFGIVLPGIDGKQAENLRNSLLKSLSAQTLRGLNGPFRLRVAVGHTQASQGDISLLEALGRATDHEQVLAPRPPKDDKS